MPSMKFRAALVTVAVGIATALTALPAAAQYRNADAAIKYRQSAMYLQNNHMGRLFAMINGQTPFDAKVAAENIEIVAMLNNRAQFAEERRALLATWADCLDRPAAQVLPLKAA